MERTFEVYEEKNMEKKIKWKQTCLHFILLVRLAAHVSNRLKSQIRPVVGRI